VSLADDPEDPYRRYKARKAAGQDHHASKEAAKVEQDHAQMKQQRQEEREHRHRKRRKARELIHDILTVAGEFVGTFLFLLLAFMGAQSATFNRGGASGQGADGGQSIVTNDNQTILFIALSFGMSLIVVAWAFFRITGSAFNPAVSFSL
jgi:cation transport ATPase